MVLDTATVPHHGTHQSSGAGRRYCKYRTRYLREPPDLPYVASDTKLEEHKEVSHQNFAIACVQAPSVAWLATALWVKGTRGQLQLESPTLALFCRRRIASA